MKHLIEDKIIFVTGGTGSWGQELTKQLLTFNPREIRIYSRGEAAQVAMQRSFVEPKLKFTIGDVRDYDALKKATKGVDVLFHLAALKHVPIAEEQPDEAIKTNIIGTQNVVNVSVENNISKIIDISTDKAVSPLNLYGMTKGVGEKIILQASKTHLNQQYMVVRSGNAMGSAGSAIPFFVNHIRRFNSVPVTDLNMTRYFITLSDAVGLVLKALESNISGGCFVTKMPACLISDLAEVLIDTYGNKDTKIIEVGIRQGEKIDEVLVSKDESRWTYKYNGKYYLIYPFKPLDLPKFELKEYTSRTYLMNKAEIKDMLNRGGFLSW
jgi:UDP-N-acetylglucosamine 4,6-dehydratase